MVLFNNMLKWTKKEKRAVLNFVLNQFKYSGDCKILIIVRTMQEASGLRAALSASPSFSLALMCIESGNGDYESFQKIKNSAGILTCEVLLSVDISHASALIYFDLPSDLRPCTERSKGRKSITYFTSSPEERASLSSLEALHGVKMREMSCLGELARNERQNALKMRLASLGNKRTKI